MAHWAVVLTYSPAGVYTDPCSLPTLAVPMRMTLPPRRGMRGYLGEHDTLLSIEKDQTAARYRPAYGWREAGTS